jgi:hypothetical protein
VQIRRLLRRGLLTDGDQRRQHPKGLCPADLRIFLHGEGHDDARSHYGIQDANMALYLPMTRETVMCQDRARRRNRIGSRM